MKTGLQFIASMWIYWKCLIKQGRSGTKIVGGGQGLEKILGFEWAKTTQMALKFLLFSGTFLNMFRTILVRQNNFCESCSFCKVFYHKNPEI